MKNINKILLLFIFIMFLAFFAVWEFLQTEWVADKVSVVATKYAKEVLNSDVKFESMEFKLFPPGAELKNVKITGEKDKFKFRSDVSSLGVYFNPFDFLNTSFQVNQVIIEDGFLDLAIKGSSKSSNNQKIILIKKAVLFLEFDTSWTYG